MSRSSLRCWAPFASVTAGLWWIADEVGGRLSPDPDHWDCNSSYDYVVNGVDAVAFLSLAAAVLALHLWQRRQAGLLGTVGSTVAMVGAIAAGINNPIEHCAHVESLGMLLWVPATLLLAGGLISVGVATSRARVLPNWSGLALILGTLAVVVAADDGGMIVFGLAWIAVAYALWSTAGQEDPISGGPGHHDPLNNGGRRRESV